MIVTFLSKKHVRTFVPDKIFDKDEFDNVSDPKIVREKRKRTRSYKKKLFQKQSTKTLQNLIKTCSNHHCSIILTRIIDSMHFLSSCYFFINFVLFRSQNLIKTFFDNHDSFSLCNISDIFFLLAGYCSIILNTSSASEQSFLCSLLNF